MNPQYVSRDEIVPEELADQVSSIYEPKQTARFYGNIVQNVTYETIERPAAFGVIKNGSKPHFINELVVTGGSPVYNATDKDEVIEGGNQIPYDPTVIQAAIDERDRLIKEGQNKPKTNTTNAKPSGASRGRQLGW
jgi:hypothetical protein